MGKSENVGAQSATAPYSRRPISSGPTNSTAPIHAIEIRSCIQSDWNDVVTLGDRFKRYLGLYPSTAISDSILDNRVIGAFDDSVLVGYVLFDLPYSDIRFVHLCVDPGSRQLGIAKKLIDEVQNRHGDRQGIRLKCRRDYEAHKMWPKLGFQAQSLLSGRGKDKAEMTAWWRAFGHPDLFSAALEDDSRVQAVLDTNVVLDIVLGREPLTQEYFDAPALAGEVVHCVTRSVKNELSDTADPSERRKVMDSLAKFETLSSELSTCDALVEELLTEVGPDELAKDGSLSSDARVLAECIVAGAAVLITNDDNAGRILRPLAKRHGVDVLHPSQLIVKIDELKGIQRDAPDRIQNTAVTISSALAGVDRELDHLISTYSGETKADFVKLVRSKAHSQVRTIHTVDSNLADGLIASKIREDSLQIELLRVRQSPLGPTLLKQLLFQLRQEARKSGAIRASVMDPHPGGGERAISILKEEGFRLINGLWTIQIIDEQLRLQDMSSDGPWNLKPWLEKEIETGEDYARLERELWPIKILNAPLPCYVVPIKQRYASELLGYDDPLLNRADSLGISRRHVYYKAANSCPQGPGRILWYVSGRYGGSIVAASQLISTHKASPEALHARFGKYGIWSLEDVSERARSTGRAVALRFGETEIFPRKIMLSKAESIVKAYGNMLGTVPTVRKIASEAFMEIYSKGMYR